MADKRENVKVNYLSRDFGTIKNDLIEHAERYYPDTFRDFSDAGFGALMIDAVSYIGDMLSFYVDYQANESFLVTANEYGNVLKHAETVGYRHQGPRSTYGDVTLYILVPANSSNTGPDLNYAPVLRAGSKFNGGGNSLFSLLTDVDFADQNNEVVVATTNASTGVPLQYAIKATGQVVSGELRTQSFDIGNFIRFRSLKIPAVHPGFIDRVHGAICSRNAVFGQGTEVGEARYTRLEIHPHIVQASVPVFSDDEFRLSNAAFSVLPSVHLVVFRTEDE